VTTPKPPSAGAPDPLGSPRTTATPGAAAGAGAPLAGGSRTPAPTPGQRPRRRGRTAGFGLAAALLVFVTVVLVLFVVFNTQTVDISLVFGNVRAPLILALVIAAGLGGLLVGLAAAVLRARRSRRSG
jgi:uncharacterized integral membrane protein